MPGTKGGGRFRSRVRPISALLRRVGILACCYALLAGCQPVRAAHLWPGQPVRSWQERSWLGVWPSPANEGCGWAAWQSLATALGCSQSQAEAAVVSAGATGGRTRASLADLYRLSLQVGLPVMPFRFSTTGLARYLQEPGPPVLLQLVRPQRHFVVALAWRPESCLVADPAQGWCVESPLTLARRASGAALVSTADMAGSSADWQQGSAAFSRWAERWAERLSSLPFRWELGARARTAEERWIGCRPNPGRQGCWLPVQVTRGRFQLSLIGVATWQSSDGWWAQLSGDAPIWGRVRQVSGTVGGEAVRVASPVTDATQVGWRVGYQWSARADTARWELSTGWAGVVGALPGRKGLAPGHWEIRLGYTQLDDPAVWRLGGSLTALPSGMISGSGEADMELVVTPRLAVSLHGSWTWDPFRCRGVSAAGIRAVWGEDSGWLRYVQVGSGDGLTVQFGWQGTGGATPAGATAAGRASAGVTPEADVVRAERLR